MRKRPAFKFLAWGFLFLLFSANLALADELTARIRGTVSDPSGASLPGAKVTATNVGTGITRELTTAPDGSFEFVQLRPGTYAVTIQQTGFKGYTASGIKLVVAQIYVLNATLELGTVTQVVQVEATAAQVESTSMQLGLVITGDTIVDLPLIGRNWIQLQQTLPGVMASSDRFGSNFATNGSRTQFNSYMINGTDSNDLPLNSPLVIPSPDAIAEVRMVTNTINPEYGRNSGAILNAVTKSGTNSIHGSGFEFFRDTSLNTRNFFQKNAAIFHQNVFGGTVGGPIWKNHTFFFFSYQGIKNFTSAGQTTSVFTAAERAGNFGSALAKSSGVSPIPLVGESGATFPAGTKYSTIFPTGKIPSADFNSISLNLMNKFVPLPNFGTRDFSFQPVNTQKTNQEITRIDHHMREKDSIFGYWFIQRQPTSRGLPFTGATLLGFGDRSTSSINNFTLGWNHIFSGNVLNEARIGYTRLNFAAVLPQAPVLPSSLGFTGISPQNTTDAGAPLISVTGLFSLGFSNNGPQPRIDQTRQLTDNFSWIRGRHTMKFGFEMRRFGVTNPFFFSNNGVFTFGGAGEFSTGSSTPGADFLLGIPDGYNQGSGDVIDAEAQQYYIYAQDQFKLRPNFTLTYGFGWQIDTPITDTFHNSKAIICFRPGQQSKVWPTAPAGAVYPGDPGCTASGYSTKYGHVGPRFGFAWTPDLGRLTGGPSKTSIRGGFGIYFNRTEEEVTLQNLGNPPYGQFSSGAGDVGGTPSFAEPFKDIAGRTGLSIANKFPFSNPAFGSAVNFGDFEPMSLNVIDPNFSAPYSMNYNVTIERELPASTILTFSYVGLLARKLHTAFELNPGINAVGCNTPGPGNTVNATGLTRCVRNRSIQNIFFPQNFRYPGDVFGSVGQQATILNSNYNSLQVTVDKRMSHGLQFRAAWTYGHSLDVLSGLEDGAFGGNTHGLNPFNIRSSYGDSQFDGRHRLAMSYIYNIPTLQRFKSMRVLDRLTDGWRFTGITTLQGGFPITLRDANFRSLTCTAFSFYACPDTPNWLGPVRILDPRTSVAISTVINPAGAARLDHYMFFPNAVQREAFGTFGSAGRNFFHGPGVNLTDFALMKDTRITESTRLELRFEFFNLFNHVQFNPRQTTSGGTNGNANSANLGRILAADGPRLVQLAAKIYF